MNQTRPIPVQKRERLRLDKFALGAFADGAAARIGRVSHAVLITPIIQPVQQMQRLLWKDLAAERQGIGDSG
jgi:hypothetical protein